MKNKQNCFVVVRLTKGTFNEPAHVCSVCEFLEDAEDLVGHLEQEAVDHSYDWLYKYEIQIATFYDKV